MHNKHWSANQLGDFPFPRRRKTDRYVEEPVSALAILSWLLLLTTSVWGVIAIVAEVAKELR